MHSSPRRSVRASAALVAIALIATTAGTFTADKAPTELQLRTAAYVSTFFNQLTLLLADEQLQFRDGKKATSEFMVLRDPGLRGELLMVRDIRTLNGQPVQGGRERLIEILQRPLDNVMDRIKQIAAASGEEIPPTFNPLFAAAFLQADYIPRFKVDERDAPVREWPRNTKMLVFVETAKPTIFRGGTFNDQDVPTRGTAWVERDTGRVLQTELQIRVGSKVTTVTTQFALDQAQQMFVPTRMTTLKPDAWATYTNYRRFRVTVQDSLKTP